MQLLTLNRFRIAGLPRPRQDRVGDVAADFGFGEEACETDFCVFPLGVVVAVDDQQRVAWFAEEAEEPRGARFDAGRIENRHGSDLAAGDRGATLTDPVEVNPHTDAQDRSDDEHRSQREARTGQATARCDAGLQQG